MAEASSTGFEGRLDERDTVDGPSLRAGIGPGEMHFDPDATSASIDPMEILSNMERGLLRGGWNSQTSTEAAQEAGPSRQPSASPQSVVRPAEGRPSGAGPLHPKSIGAAFRGRDLRTRSISVKIDRK